MRFKRCNLEFVLFSHGRYLCIEFVIHDCALFADDWPHGVCYIVIHTGNCCNNGLVWLCTGALSALSDWSWHCFALPTYKDRLIFRCELLQPLLRNDLWACIKHPLLACITFQHIAGIQEVTDTAIVIGIRFPVLWEWWWVGGRELKWIWRCRWLGLCGLK